MSAETLVMFAAAIISLGVSYTPGLNTRFAELPDETKKLTMALLMLLVAGYVFLESCTGFPLLNIAVTCDQAGAAGLIRTYILALVVNQGTFKVSPQLAVVKAAKID